MVIRTFVYAGKEDALFVDFRNGNIELKRNQRFTTDDPAIAKRLLEHPDVREEKEGTDTKPSSRKNAAQ